MSELIKEFWYAPVFWPVAIVFWLLEQTESWEFGVIIAVLGTAFILVSMPVVAALQIVFIALALVAAPISLIWKLVA